VSFGDLGDEFGEGTGGGLFIVSEAPSRKHPFHPTPIAPGVLMIHPLVHGMVFVVDDQFFQGDGTRPRVQ